MGDDDATWKVLATGGTIGMVQAILCSCKEITLKLKRKMKTGVSIDGDCVCDSLS